MSNIKTRPSPAPDAVPVRTDTVAGNDYQVIKAGFGPNGSATHVDDADGSRWPIGGGQIGALNETAPASDTASAGVNGRLQRLAQRLTSLIALLPTSLGAGGGIKVDGSGTALPVSGTVTASGGALETTQAAQSTLIGAVTETAPASDTASSGLNGRLQRIAQRLTSLIALLPAALTGGGGVKVGLVDAIIAGTNIIGKVIRAETTVAATIAIGTSTTIGIVADVRGYVIVGLVVPSTFDGTTISFQVSHDNSTFQALYDATNTLVSMTIAASRTYAPWAELQGWSYIKIITGSTQTTTDTLFVWQVQS